MYIQEAEEGTSPLLSFLHPFVMIFTPHTQREWDKVIGVGVHIFVDGEKIESYFSNRLTFQTFVARVGVMPGPLTIDRMIK